MYIHPGRLEVVCLFLKTTKRGRLPWWWWRKHGLWGHSLPLSSSDAYCQFTYLCSSILRSIATPVWSRTHMINSGQILSKTKEPEGLWGKWMRLRVLLGVSWLMACFVYVCAMLVFVFILPSREWSGCLARDLIIYIPISLLIFVELLKLNKYKYSLKQSNSMSLLCLIG